MFAGGTRETENLRWRCEIVAGTGEKSRENGRRMQHGDMVSVDEVLIKEKR